MAHRILWTASVRRGPVRNAVLAIGRTDDHQDYGRPHVEPPFQGVPGRIMVHLISCVVCRTFSLRCTMAPSEWPLR
jgi:hypothetical protein